MGIFSDSKNEVEIPAMIDEQLVKTYNKQMDRRHLLDSLFMSPENIEDLENEGTEG